MFLGEIIYKYRKENNLTMDDFAKLSGLSKSYISMLEKNKHPQSSRKLVPSVETFKKVASAMNIDSDELFRIVDSGQLVKLNVSCNDSFEGLTNVSFPAAHPIPILGDICAGDGILCEENYMGNFFIDNSVKADFCVNVHGDSMIDAGIQNGDLAFCRQDFDFYSGKIYAVRINSNNDAVLKRVIRQDDTLILAPCNKDYDPIVSDDEGVMILGEYVGVYHSEI